VVATTRAVLGKAKRRSAALRVPIAAVAKAVDMTEVQGVPLCPICSSYRTMFGALLISIAACAASPRPVAPAVILLPKTDAPPPAAVGPDRRWWPG
jgi:hypothetical protein